MPPPESDSITFSLRGHRLEHRQEGRVSDDEAATLQEEAEEEAAILRQIEDALVVHL